MTGYDLSRRRVLQAGAAAVGLGGFTTGTASGKVIEGGIDGTSSDVRQIPCLDLTGEDIGTDRETSGLPERARGVRPGSLMLVHFPGGTTAGCTSNFVWRDTSQDPPGLYIGAAGHCFLPSGANASKNAKRSVETNSDVYDVSGLEVELCTNCSFGGALGNFVVEGTTVGLGEVAYARQRLPDGRDVGHDFGVVEIPATLEDAVDPSMPQWGGPTGVTNDPVSPGEPVHQYGAGIGNGEVYQTRGRTGVSGGSRENSAGWVATMRGSPGDSGSPLVSSRTPSTLLPEGENAAGILTHLVLSSRLFETGTAGTTIGRCKELASTDVGFDLEVELV